MRHPATRPSRWLGRLLPILLVLTCAAGAAQAADGTPQTVSLWPAGHWPAVTHGPERVGRDGSARGAVSNVSEPRMEIYRPQRPNGNAVVIFGGGGYFRIQIGGAARPTALWLQSLGVTAAVVYYRLPADGWSALSPFQDGQRAVRLMRAHAAEWGVDPDKIGAIGFSAGAHLAGILGTRYDEAFYPAVDAADALSARPDYLGLIYPVISLAPPLDDTRSRRELGTQADAVQAYSVERHVHAGMPPVFLAQAVDDTTVDVGHSLAMYQAARTARVPVEMHLFEKGGHSWGLGRPGSLVAQWPRLFANWSRSHGFLGAPPQQVPALPGTATPAAPDAADDARDETGD